MSSLWTRMWKSTPKIDCGMCGLPNCASFGRAIIFGELPVDACPFLSLNEYSNMRNELLSLLKRAPNPRAKLSPEQPEEGVLLTRPCKDTNDRVMAELRVFNGVPTGEPVRFGVFDPRILCELMDCLVDNFEVVKCSRDLGYGRADTGEMSITMLQDGRINMRRVTDREEVLQLFGSLERALFGSVVCNSCGRDLLSIMVDASTSPDEAEHQILFGGSSFNLDSSQVGVPLTKQEWISSMGTAGEPTSEYIDAIIRWIRENYATGTPITSEVNIDNQVDDTRKSLVQMIANSTLYGNETIILRALGFLSKLESAVEGVSELRTTLPMLDAETEQDWVDTAIAQLDYELPEYQIETEHPRLLHVFGYLKRIHTALSLAKEWS